MYHWRGRKSSVTPNYLKMGLNTITKVCLAVAAATVLLNGIVCPFPRDDPRSIFNPVIVPWWRFTPRRAREVLHLTFAGGPLPPDPQGLGPLPRCPTFAGPCRPRPRGPRPRSRFPRARGYP